MSHSPEQYDTTSEADHHERFAKHARTAGRWAGRVAAGATIVYGAFMLLDGATRATVDVFEANGGTGYPVVFEAIHDGADAVTPDFVTDPIRAGIDPGWQSSVEIGAGLLIGVAGLTLRDTAEL